MSELTITIRIQVPDNATVTVGGAQAPVGGPQSAYPEEPPFPTSFTPGQVMERPDDWPAGKCPRHDRAFISGQFGLHCTAQDGPPDVNAKGYCTLAPGKVWQGRRIP